MANDNVDLKIALVEFLKNAIKPKIVAGKMRDVRVITSDPATHEELPCISINYLDDSEKDFTFNNLLDQQLSQVVNPDDASIVRQSLLMSEVCEVRIWVDEQPDLRDQLGVLLKELLLMAKNALGQQGFGNMFIVGGRDENDFATYAPKKLYMRPYNFMALAQMDVWPDVPDQTAGVITEVDSTVVTAPPEQP